MFEHHKKESPILSLTGMGGGAASYIFYGTSASGEVYEISRSTRFDGSDSAYAVVESTNSGSRTTWTFSAWVKKCATGSTYAMFGVGTDSNNLDAIDFNGEQLRYTRSTSGSFKSVKTNTQYTNSSDWLHVVCAVDTTQSTPSDRVKLYVNGTLQTNLAATDYPSENENTLFNSGEKHVLGRRSLVQDNYFDGYMADVHFVVGSQLAASDFGQTIDSAWQPKEYSSSHGTNGFHFPFSTHSEGFKHISSISYTNGQKSGIPENMFDGSLTTNFGIFGDNTTTNFNSFDLTLPQTFSGTLRGYIRSETSYGTPIFKLYNGGSEVFSQTVNTGNSVNWYSFGSVTFNRIYAEITKHSGAGSGFEIHQWELDGEYMVDGSTTFVDNSGNSNNYKAVGITSSIGEGYGATLTTNNSKNPITTPEAAFDGSTSTTAALVLETGGTRGMVWTPTFPITVNTQLRVYWKSWTAPQYNSGYVYVNGSNQGQVASGLNGWHDVGFTGTLNSLELRSVYNSGSGHGINLAAVEVDGYILKSDYTEVDTVRDSPVGITTTVGNNIGNYATMDPSQKGSNVTLSNGNLRQATSGSPNAVVVCDTGMSSGKYYCEFKFESGLANIGVTRATTLTNSYMGQAAGDYGWYSSNGNKYSGGSNSSYGDSYSPGDILGIAFNADDGELYFYKNGTIQNSGTAAYTGLTNGPYYFAGGEGAGGGMNGSWNFGQQPYVFTIPTNYTSLCSTNIS